MSSMAHALNSVCTDQISKVTSCSISRSMILQLQLSSATHASYTFRLQESRCNRLDKTIVLEEGYTSCRGHERRISIRTNDL